MQERNHKAVVKRVVGLNNVEIKLYQSRIAGIER